jgi:hypothetical protein
VAPADFAAQRRGDDVDIQFTVPATNTDGSRPANIQRIDVFAIDGAAPGPDSELLKQAKRVATVDVKAPRDPNAVTEPDEPQEDVEPLEGTGLDQGASAHVHDRIVEPSLAVPEAQGGRAARTYVGVGVNKKGRRGPMSKRALVPLLPPPRAPDAPKVQYDEQHIAISWETPAMSAEAPAGVLVYEALREGPPVRVTPAPVTQTSADDPRKERFEWGAERCYVVTSVQEVPDGLRIESNASPPTCVTLVDTFPPKPPTGLTTVPQEGAISLIWNSNTEPDLAGYRVLRGAPGDETLIAITPQLLDAPSFLDTVDAGRRVVYAVEAIDKAGNKSAPSERVEETAR